MKNLVFMRQNKDAKLEEVRAILDKAEAEGRNLTAEENARYSAGMKEVKKLTEEYEAERELQDREMKGGGIPIDGHGPASGDFRSFNRDNFHEIRSIYGHPRDGMTLDSWLRGIITGRGESRQEPATVGAIGMYSVPDELFGQLIYDSFGKTCVVEAGARVVDMQGMTMYVPRLVGLPATEWLGELETATRDEFTWTGQTLEAKKLSVQVATSVELYADSQLVREEVGQILSKALALELDRAAILGAANGPLGLVNTPNVLTLDVGGPITSYLPLTYAYGQVKEQCGYDPTGVILSPNAWAQFDSLTATDGQPLQPPPSYATYRKLSACYLQGDEYENGDHVGVMGDFRRLFWAVRSGAQIEISRCADSAWRDYRVEIRAHLRAAPCVITPQAFCVLTGIEGIDLSTLPANG